MKVTKIMKNNALAGASGPGAPPGRAGASSATLPGERLWCPADTEVWKTVRANRLRRRQENMSVVLQVFSNASSLLYPPSAPAAHRTKPRDNVVVLTRLDQQEATHPPNREQPIRGLSVVIDGSFEQSRSLSTSRSDRNVHEENVCHV